MKYITLVILFLIGFLWSFADSYGEQEYHIPFAGSDEPTPLHSSQPAKTSVPCWHSELMRLSEVLINDPDSVPNLVLNRDDKKFYHNPKSHASVEMMKGSRMEVFETKDSCELILAFRGTYQGALTVDLLQDLNFVPTKEQFDYHPGFYDVAKSYRINIKRVLDESKRRCGQQQLKVTVTGHSLGGAVAFSVVNLMRDLDLGRSELVLFGTPRVVTRYSDLKERVKPVHYYLDRDPVVIIPPGLIFRELTDNLYQFEKIPFDHKPSMTAHYLFQNHLPSSYRIKMEKWCEGKESPIKVTQFSHTLKGSGIDASARLLRTGVDAAGNVILPSKDKNGGNLPSLSQTFDSIFLNSPWAKSKSLSLNQTDGKQAAGIMVCSVTHILGSKTKAGRSYYCNGEAGPNRSSEKGCRSKCVLEKGISKQCFMGCLEHIRGFCTKEWACPGDPLAG